MEWLILCAVAIAFAGVRKVLLDASAASRLASRVGFSPVEAFSSHPQDWFTGVVQGRRVAIGQVVLRLPFPRLFRKRSPHLRIAMDVVTRAPLPAMAIRSHLDSSSLHRFEEAFRTENANVFTADARQALLSFVSRGYSGTASARATSTAHNVRNLRLSNRASVPEDLLPARVLSGARTVLIHDHPRLHLSADEFGQLLSELANVAAAAEDSARDSHPTEPVWPPARQ